MVCGRRRWEWWRWVVHGRGYEWSEGDELCYWGLYGFRMKLVTDGGRSSDGLVCDGG